MIVLPTIDCKYKLTVYAVAFLSFSLAYCNHRCKLACITNDEARKQCERSA
jgi:hypothetical protein